MLLLFVAATASYSWNLTGDWRAGIEAAGGAGSVSTAGGGVHPGVLMGGGSILGLIFAVATIFKKNWAPVTAPLYALSEGFMLGAISALAELKFPGIAFQATCMTFCTLFGLLLAYKSGLIRATENFKLGLFAAMSGIFMIYLVTWIVGLFGGSMPFIHSSGAMGIGFSAVVVVIAALNLVMDFDFIEHGAEIGPRSTWSGTGRSDYGDAIWLYLEILRLLMKTQSRR
ncbi:MAG: membrane protein [Planctomycetaceae bacterium]|nr:MAG: membrane protein [Planctomycetaceae bacterium]